MTPIKDITGLPSELKGIQKNKGVSGKNLLQSSHAKKASLADGVRKNQHDRVDISHVGKELLEQKAELSAYLKDIKSNELLDNDAIEEIRGKVYSDFYSQPKVLHQITEALSVVPGMEVPPIDSDNPDINRMEHLDKIKDKLDNGEYNSSKVLDVIVNKLIENL